MFVDLNRLEGLGKYGGDPVPRDRVTTVRAPTVSFKGPRHAPVADTEDSAVTGRKKVGGGIQRLTADGAFLIRLGFCTARSLANCDVTIGGWS